MCARLCSQDNAFTPYEQKPLRLKRFVQRTTTRLNTLMVRLLNLPAGAPMFVLDPLPMNSASFSSLVSSVESVAPNRVC